MHHKHTSHFPLNRCVHTVQATYYLHYYSNSNVYYNLSTNKISGQMLAKWHQPDVTNETGLIFRLLIPLVTAPLRATVTSSMVTGLYLRFIDDPALPSASNSSGTAEILPDLSEAHRPFFPVNQYVFIWPALCNEYMNDIKLDRFYSSFWVCVALATAKKVLLSATFARG